MVDGGVGGAAGELEAGLVLFPGGLSWLGKERFALWVCPGCTGSFVDGAVRVYRGEAWGVRGC